MDVLWGLLAILVVVVLLFYLVRFAIRLWTGCSKEEAAEQIYAVMRRSTADYQLAKDALLIQDLWDAVHTVIGDVRYKQIEQLSQHMPIFACGAASGLPYIALAVSCNNANEKAQIESLVRQKVERALAIHGKQQRVLEDWKFNPDLQMDMLVVRCAETKEEMEILLSTHAYNGNQMIQRNAPLRDKEIDDE